ncbi:MAG: CDP-diacylglycerol--serine O-phosphatidyltransferase [Bacillaceae bacterium]
MFRNMIPNLFTLGNLYCGFLAVGYVSQGKVNDAAILVLIGMILDSMDGRVARMLKVDSPLGKELDSLADIVTFGVAPSFLMYATVFENTGLTGLFVAGLFPLFGAYRLARFNVTPTATSLKYFTGVPITAAGTIVALLTLIHHMISPIISIVVFVSLAFLMVSRIKIPSFKDIPLPRYGTIGTIFVGVALFVMWQTKKFDWPAFYYVALPLYLIWITFYFVKSKKQPNQKKKWRIRKKKQ